MRKVFLVVFIWFVILPQFISAQAPVRITCVGNSITEGYGNTNATKTWPAQLEKLLGSGYSVFNCGVSGTTMLKNGNSSYWNTARFIEAKNSDPQILIIKLGTNDAGSNNWVHKSEFYTDYVAMINEFRKNGRNPIIYVCFPVPVYGNANQNAIIEDEVIPLIDSVRKTFNTYSIDFHTALLSNGNDFPDGVHPNDAGSLVLANVAYNIIKNNQLIVPYISIDSAPTQQTNSAVIDVEQDVLLDPYPQDGTWNWIGPNGFNSTSRAITLSNTQFNEGGIYTANYISPDGWRSVQNFMVSLNGCNAASITPYNQVNNGAWQTVTSLTVNPGSIINFGPQASETDGTWTWTGPNNFFSNARQITINTILKTQAGNYTAYNYNNNGCKSTQSFNVEVAGEIVCPTLISNININGMWKQQATASLNTGEGVTFGPQPTDGEWRWIGPNNFSSSLRETSVKNIQLNQAGEYIGIFTNAVGCKDSLFLTINVSGIDGCLPPIIPYVNVNGISWLQENTVTLNAGDSVTLGPQPLDPGTWNWTGPNGFTSSVREIFLSNIQVEQAGVYKSSFTNSSACESLMDFTITVNIINGIDTEQENSIQFFYPNPTENMVTLTNIPSSTNIRIMNMSGQELIKIKSLNKKGNINLNVGDLKSGLYLIKIGDNNVKTFKLIKQ